ncbi:SDR family NAD(P)-dependent oxidoreductase [Streptomyces sp. NPDC058653]|uniref:SDR family NAD(P)-dependent oxidoreductase n=1 Tax=Streptomyces sp. NPDC058653 TaxID=3346576 RepID=UPI003661DCD3
MDLQLVGKRALVTGSSSGLGEAIARRLAAEGATIVVHGRDRARATAVAKSIREDGGVADIAIGDLATDSGAAHVQDAAAQDGPVDILVNNVGVYEPTARWGDTPPDSWAEIYNINVISGVRMIQRLLPDMRARGWGRVIQISSVTGHRPAASQPHYASTNAARNNLAVSLARELKHSGVTSNAVAAEGILTPATLDLLVGVGRAQGWGETWAEIEPKTAALAPNDAGRIAGPEEYANVVAFLASPAAGYINGTTLHVDGGAYDV